MHFTVVALINSERDHFLAQQVEKTPQCNKASITRSTTIQNFAPRILNRVRTPYIIQQRYIVEYVACAHLLQCFLHTVDVKTILRLGRLL